MTTESVTPVPGLVHEVVTAGIAVTAVAAGPNGGFITNPPDATEYLYVDPVGTATTQAVDTTFAIPPGGSWSLIPGQTTPTSVNAPDDNHSFSVVSF